MNREPMDRGREMPTGVSEDEIATLGATLVISKADTRELRVRMACAAALLDRLPSQPERPSLIFESPEAPGVAIAEIGDELVVGREAEGAGRLTTHASLSRRHFRIFPDSGLHILEDLGSANGTFLDGSPAPVASRPLRDGDFILAGTHAFLFVDPTD